MAGLDKTENLKGGSGDYWIVKLTPEKPVQPETTIRINAGGPEFITGTKKKFSADLYYSGIDHTRCGLSFGRKAGSECEYQGVFNWDLLCPDWTVRREFSGSEGVGWKVIQNQ
jgi:hypothetical protein